MPFGTHRLAIGIVIELDEFQSPPNEHRVERGENKSNRNPKTLRSCFRRAERRFLTSQILPPKRSSRRPRQELADYLLTPCVQPSLRRLSSTYSQSSAKFNCRFASRPICHVRAGSALPSIEDLDERSRGKRHEQSRGCDEHEDAGDHHGEEDFVHFCQCGLPIFVPILAGPASDARSPKEPPA